MRLEEVMYIHESVKSRVHRSCVEYHAHSALNGCLSGDKDALTICGLCEEIIRLRTKMEQIYDISRGVRT